MTKGNIGKRGDAAAGGYADGGQPTYGCCDTQAKPCPRRARLDARARDARARPGAAAAGGVSAPSLWNGFPDRGTQVLSIVGAGLPIVGPGVSMDGAGLPNVAAGLQPADGQATSLPP